MWVVEEGRGAGGTKFGRELEEGGGGNAEVCGGGEWRGRCREEWWGADEACEDVSWGVCGSWKAQISWLF